MASWFWLNVPLMAVFFLATAGIPLWLVLRRPDRTSGDRKASAALKEQAAAEQSAQSQKVRPGRGLQLTH
jgi:hypothetical protein